MNVLVVDDDLVKRKNIESVIVDAVGSINVAITGVASAGEAMSMLEATQFDFMILDLNLPVRNGEAPSTDAGVDLLQKLSKGGPRFRIPPHILGVTAFADLETRFSKEFTLLGWTLVEYVSSSDGWRVAIEAKTRHVFNACATNMHSSYGTDIAIVTALRDIELEAVLDLPCDWSDVKFEGDDTFYNRGTFVRGGKKLSVIAASAAEMGIGASACLAMKMINTFRPRVLAMCGIAAGVKGDFGDVLFADQCWDYGAGKVRQGSGRSIFAPSPSYISVGQDIKGRFQEFAMKDGACLSEIRRKWRDDSVPGSIRLHVGPLASGAAVIESEEAIAKIVAQNRKVIGVEMEGYGVFMAARTASLPRPSAVVIKSKCDSGVPPKTDEFQRYAAYTSASVFYEFALRMLPNG